MVVGADADSKKSSHHIGDHQSQTPSIVCYGFLNPVSPEAQLCDC